MYKIYLDGNLTDELIKYNPLVIKNINDVDVETNELLLYAAVILNIEYGIWAELTITSISSSTWKPPLDYLNYLN